MMQLAALFGCLAVVTGTGAALGTLLRMRSDERDAPLGFGWSFLYGSASVSLVLHLPLALTGNLPHLYYYVVLAVGTLLTAWFLWHRWQHPGWPLALRQGWLFDLPKILRAAVLTFAAFGLASAVIMPMNSYDGRAAFALKSRVLYDTQTIRNEDFEDLNRLHFNAHYPLLVPLLLAQTYAAQDTLNDAHSRVLFGMFVAALISVVIGELRRHMTARAAAGWGLLLLLTPMVATTFEGGGLSASADIPLAGFVTAAVIAFGRWLTQPRANTAFTAGLMLGAGCLTKAEGTIWVAAMGASFLAIIVWRRFRFNRRACVSLLAGAFALGTCLALSHFARRYVPHSPYLREYGQAFRWDWLTQVWARPLDIAWYALQDYTRISRWNLFWPLLIGSFVLLNRRPEHARTTDGVWYLRAVTALVFLAYIAIFVITPYHLQFHLRTALCRLSLQFLPLASIALAEQVMASTWVTQTFVEWRKPRIDPADDQEVIANLRYFRVEAPPERKAG